MTEKKDISVVINLHNEGILCYPTLRSVADAISRAQENGISCELLIIVDNPPEEMSALVKNYMNNINSVTKFDYSIVEANFKDLGLSRNKGTELSKGKYISFIDGDDLWGEDWLVNCYRFYESQSEEIVLHPEVNFIFGVEHHIFFHTDMDSKEFELDYLRINNYWTALSFALKSTYTRIPYEMNRIKEGFGFEDWNWNCRTIKENIKHKIAPDTCHFIRKKEFGSMLSDTNKNKCILTPNNLFEFRKH